MITILFYKDSMQGFAYIAVDRCRYVDFDHDTIELFWYTFEHEPTRAYLTLQGVSA